MLTETEVYLHTKVKVVLGCLKISLEFLQDIPGLGVVQEKGLNVFLQGDESSNEVARRHVYLEQTLQKYKS